MNVSPDGPSVHAYHWQTFGSTAGIPVELPTEINDCFMVTAFISRNRIHLISLDNDAHKCHSVVLDITRKTTEFMFQESGRTGLRANKNDKSARNPFLDCHAEVWTRFPVVPAVKRQTISALDRRYPRTLRFVTWRDHVEYARYFAEMVVEFERSSRKPTGSELNIIITASDRRAFIHELAEDQDDVSEFRAGEWVMDLLCLIPIQIAITRGNRFIPLKDGVWSTDLERALLGAEVARIVDHLSFGWYESIFKSYMATKVCRASRSIPSS